MNNRSTTDIDRTIGVRIKALRKAKGLTQVELGVAAGVTYQQVQKYEDGTNRVSGGRMQDFARVLEVPVSTLFGESQGTEADVTVLLSTPGARDLINAYTAIDDKQLQRDVLAIVRTAIRNSVGPFSEGV